MENASKALIMAASVLLGVMIISIAVYLFSSLGSYSSESYKKMEQAKIDEFNSQFLKFYGQRINEATNKPEPIKCTAHDIASLANLAKQNNTKYEVSNLKQYNQNTYYIQVNVKSKKNSLESWSENDLLVFIQDNATINGNIKEYYVPSAPIISTATKRVCYIEFEEYK